MGTVNAQTGYQLSQRFRARLAERGIAGEQAAALSSRFDQRMMERGIAPATKPSPQNQPAFDPHSEGHAYSPSPRPLVAGMPGVYVEGGATIQPGDPGYDTQKGKAYEARQAEFQAPFIKRAKENEPYPMPQTPGQAAQLVGSALTEPDTIKKVGGGLFAGLKGFQGGAASVIGTGAGMIGADEIAAAFHGAGETLARESQDLQKTPAGQLGQLAFQSAPSAAMLLASKGRAAPALRAATNVTALGSMSLASAGQGIQQYRDHKIAKGEAPDPFVEAGIGAAYGTAEWFFERFGVQATGQALGVMAQEAASVFAKQAPAPAAIYRALVAGGESMGVNMTEEMLTQGAQNITDQFYNPERQLGDQVAESGIAGAGQGLLMLGGGLGAQALARPTRAPAFPPEKPVTTGPAVPAMPPAPASMENAALSKLTADIQARLSGQPVVLPPEVEVKVQEIEAKLAQMTPDQRAEALAEIGLAPQGGRAPKLTVEQMEATRLEFEQLAAEVERAQQPPEQDEATFQRLGLRPGAGGPAQARPEAPGARTPPGAARTEEDGSEQPSGDIRAEPAKGVTDAPAEQAPEEDGGQTQSPAVPEEKGGATQGAPGGAAAEQAGLLSDVASMPFAALRKAAKDRGLETTGNRAALVKRLTGSLSPRPGPTVKAVAPGPAAKEPWEMTKAEHREVEPKLVAATAARDKAQAEVGGTSRWGETRRFQGKSAGLRLERSDKARERWSKAFDDADAKHRDAVKKALAAGKPVPANVLAEYPDLAKEKVAPTTAGERPDPRRSPDAGAGGQQEQDSDAPELWQLTRAQVREMEIEGQTEEESLAMHRAAVREAIAAGKAVPAEVLANYPDLQERAKDTPAPTGRLARFRRMAARMIEKAEALERNSSRRFDNAPGAAVTGGSGRRRSGLHKKTDQAIEGSLNDLNKAKRLRETAAKWSARADNIDPAVIAKRDERKAVVETARERVKEAESAERKAAPIVNEDRPGVVRMTSEEWKKTHSDYKAVSVKDGVRVRSVVKGGTLSDVFITDMPVKNRASAVDAGSEVKVSAAESQKYDIYRVNVKGRGEMFAVRESEHASGFGDSMFPVVAAAQEYAKTTKARDEANAASRAKRQEQEKAAFDVGAASEKERNDIDGFGSDLDAMRRGRVVAALNKWVRFREQSITTKDLVRKLVADGSELTTTEEPAVKPMTRTEFNRADQRQQDAHAKRMKEAGNKTIYRVGGYDLGKIAYDYAAHLSRKSQAAAVSRIDAATVKAGDEVLLERQDTPAGEPTEYAPAVVEGVKVMFGEPHVKFVRGEKWRKASELRVFKRSPTAAAPTAPAAAPASPSPAAAAPASPATSPSAPRAAAAPTPQSTPGTPASTPASPGQAGSVQTPAGQGAVASPKPTTSAPVGGFLSNLSPEKQARALELEKRLRAKLNNELRSGFDPEMLAIGAEYGALAFEAGAKRFAAFAREVVGRIGVEIKPYLRAMYAGARQMPGVDKAGTDSGDYVDGLTDADVDSMVGETAAPVAPPAPQADGPITINEFVTWGSGHVKHFGQVFKVRASRGMRGTAEVRVWSPQGFGETIEEPIENLRRPTYQEMPDALRDLDPTYEAVDDVGVKFADVYADQDVPWEKMTRVQREDVIAKSAAGFARAAAAIRSGKPVDFGDATQDVAERAVTPESYAYLQFKDFHEIARHFGNQNATVTQRNDGVAIVRFQNQDPILFAETDAGEWRQYQAAPETAPASQDRSTLEAWARSLRALARVAKNEAAAAVLNGFARDIDANIAADAPTLAEIGGRIVSAARKTSSADARSSLEKIGSGLGGAQPTALAGTPEPEITIGKYRVFKRPGEGWVFNWTDNSGATQGRRGLKTKEEAVAMAERAHAEDQANAEQRIKLYPMHLSEWPSVKKSLLTGGFNAEQHKERFRWLVRSESAIKEELGKRKLKELAPNGTGGRTKSDIIDAIYNQMLSWFNLGRSVQYSPFQGETHAGAMTKAIESITDEDIAKHKAAIAARVAAKEKALENPETLDEFRRFIDAKGEPALSMDQRKRYDALQAEHNKMLRGDDRPDHIAKVDTGGVMLTQKQGFHEKLGIPLYIVQMSGRVEDATYKALVAAAKKLGGWWSSFKKDSAGFQFKTKEAADEFVKVNQQSISTEATDKVREASAEQRAAERLIELADSKVEAAEGELGKDRNTNTVRRARMAEGAESTARKAKQLAETLANIAEGIQKGTVKALRGIRNMTQLGELERVLMLAQREYFYSLPEEARRALEPSGQWWNLPIDENVIAKAVMPLPELHISHLREITATGLNTPGIKREAAKLDRLWRREQRKNPDIVVVKIDNPYDFTAAKMVASRLKVGAKKYSAEAVSEQIMHHQRVADMGIKSSAEMRVALREYAGLRAGQVKPDALREMERALIGKTVGIDFFPTPPAVAENLVERADIQEGMRVLEPSAGTGRIADALRGAGATPDVLEVSSDLRAILKAKAHNVVGQDFLSYEPGPVYDRIVMNPPFSGRVDIDHVRHAYSLLKPGGRIVAIMSEGPFFASDKKSTAFREWLDEVGVSEQLPEGTFASDKMGLPTTGVNARVVTIDKPQAKGDRLDVSFGGVSLGTVAGPDAAPAARDVNVPNPLLGTDESGKPIAASQLRLVNRDGGAPDAIPAKAGAESLPDLLARKMQLEKDARSAFYRSTGHRDSDPAAYKKHRDEEDRLQKEADTLAGEVAKHTEAVVGEYPGDIPSDARRTLPPMDSAGGKAVLSQWESANKAMEELWAEERAAQSEVGKRQYGSKVREKAEAKKKALREKIEKHDSLWKSTREKMIRIKQEDAFFGPDPWRKLGVLASWYPGKYTEVSQYLLKAADHIVGVLAPELTVEDRGIVARDAVSTFLEGPLSQSLTGRMSDKLYVFKKRAAQKAASDAIEATAPLETRERREAQRDIENMDDPAKMQEVVEKYKEIAASRDKVEREVARIQEEALAKKREANTNALLNPSLLKPVNAKRALRAFGVPTTSPVVATKHHAIWMNKDIIPPKVFEQIRAVPEEPIAFRGRTITPDEVRQFTNEMSQKATLPVTILGVLNGEDGAPLVMYTTGEQKEVRAVDGQVFAFMRTLAPDGEWFAPEETGPIVLRQDGKPVAMVSPRTDEATPPIDLDRAAGKARRGWKDEPSAAPINTFKRAAPEQTETIDTAAFPTFEEIGISTAYTRQRDEAEAASAAYWQIVGEGEQVRQQARERLDKKSREVRESAPDADPVHRLAVRLSGSQKPDAYFYGRAYDTLIDDDTEVQAFANKKAEAKAAADKLEHAKAQGVSALQNAWTPEVDNKYRELVQNKRWWQLQQELDRLKRLWPEAGTKDPRSNVLEDLVTSKTEARDTTGEVLPPGFKEGGSGNFTFKNVNEMEDVGGSAFGVRPVDLTTRNQERGPATYVMSFTTDPAVADAAVVENKDLFKGMAHSGVLPAVETIKKIAKNVPEFRADPVFTVSADLSMLEWSAGTIKYRVTNPWGGQGRESVDAKGKKTTEPYSPIKAGETVRVDLDQIDKLGSRWMLYAAPDTTVSAETAAGKKAATVLEKLDRIAKNAIARMEARAKERGTRLGANQFADPGFLLDMTDTAVLIAAKGAALGITGAKQGAKIARRLSKLVQEQLDTLTPERKAALAPHAKAIRSAAKRMLRDSGGTPEGLLAAYAKARESIDRRRTKAVGEAIGDPAAVRAAVAGEARERPEVRRPGEKREARLVRLLQQGDKREEAKQQAGEAAGFQEGRGVGEVLGAARVASKAVSAIVGATKKGYRAGLATARSEFMQMAQQARAEEKRLKQIDKIDERARREAERILEFREAAQRIVLALPERVRGRLIRGMVKAKTLSDVARIATKARYWIARNEARYHAGQLAKLQKRLKQLEETRRDIVRFALHRAGQAIEKLNSLSDRGSLKTLYKTTALVEDALETIRAARAESALQFAEQRNEDQIYVFNRNYDASHMRKDIKANLDKRKDLARGDAPDGARNPGAIKRFLRKYANPRTIAYMLDMDWWGKGPVFTLYRAMMNARRQVLKREHAFRDGFAQIVKRNGYKNLAEFMADVSGTLGSHRQKYIDIGMGGYKRLTLGQALYIYAMDAETREHAHNGNEFLFRSDRNGDKFTLNDYRFAEIEAQIPDNLKRIVDQAKALHDGMFFDDLSRINKVLNGEYLTKVPGYWGINRAIDRSTLNGVPQSWKEYLIPALENAGILKERTGGRAPILIGDFGVDVLRRSEAAATIAEKAELVRAVRMTLLHPDTTTAINTKLGERMVNRLNNIVADFAGRDLSQKYDIIRKLMGNWARAKTQLWIPTWLRNIGSAYLLPAVMPVKTVLKGMRGGFVDVPAYHAIMKHVPEARERWEGAAGATSFLLPGAGGSHTGANTLAAGKATLRQMVDAVASLRKLSRREFGRRLADVEHPWQEFLDSLTAGNVFDAAAATVAYRGYLSEAPEAWTQNRRERWAARKAWDAFVQVGNTNDVLNRTEFQQDAETSTLVASFLTFTSDIAKKQNLLVQSMHRGKKEKAAAAAGVAMSIFWGGLITAGLSKLLGDDDEEAIEAGLVRAAGETVGLLPLSTAWQGAVKKMTGKSGAQDAISSPAIEIINGGIDIFTGLLEAADDSDNQLSTNEQLLRISGRAFQYANDLAGSPAGQYFGAARKAARNYGEED